MKVVLSLGRLHPLKGLDLLISAWAEVKKCVNARMRECANEGEISSSGQYQLAAGREKCVNALMNSRTNALPVWQLVIAGPDEQGTKEKLIRLCQGFHLRGAYGGQDGGQEVISESSFADTATADKKLKLKWCECAGMDACEGDADIVFLGAVQGKEKWALMQRADIFVLPSRSENFGIVVGEALSCGVPVVTTAVGPWGEPASLESYAAPGEVSGNEEMHEVERGEAGDELPLARADGKRGLIIVETSVAGISEGLRQMMALSDAERKEMGQKGCEWVKREFSWEGVAQEMLEAYESARMLECVNVRDILGLRKKTF